jgi:hypothetical protein
MDKNTPADNKQIDNRASDLLLLSPDIYRDARLESSNSIQQS